MGTFNRRPVHKGRMMKALTTFLLVGLVTMLWSASVTGDQSTLKEVLGFDENYCRGKSDGIFCKTNEPFPWSKRNRYDFGECCEGKCYSFGQKSGPACDKLREVREKDSDLGFCYSARTNTSCRFKNANNEYEDGQWCQGKPDSEACNFYELGYDRRYHVIHGKCCLDAILQSPTCIRASDKC